MFLYFNKSGVLKEQITDYPLRQYSTNTEKNTIYVYVESDIEEVETATIMNAKKISVNIGNVYRYVGSNTATYTNGKAYKLDSNLNYSEIDYSPLRNGLISLWYWFGFPNGTEISTVQGVHYQCPRPDTIVKEIPYDQFRDLKFFKYGVKYEMFHFQVPSGQRLNPESEQTAIMDNNVMAVAGPVGLSMQMHESVNIIQDVATEEAMNALKVAENVDNIYRYTGTTTATYTQYRVYKLNNLLSFQEINPNAGQPMLGLVALKIESSVEDTAAQTTTIAQFEYMTGRMSTLTAEVNSIKGLGTLHFIDTAPETATSNGTKGECYIDTTTNYLYICVATNTWMRTQLSTW